MHLGNKKSQNCRVWRGRLVVFLAPGVILRHIPAQKSIPTAFLENEKNNMNNL